MGNYCMKPVEEKETLNKEIEEIKYYDKQGKSIPKEEWEKNWSKKEGIPKQKNVSDPNENKFINKALEIGQLVTEKNKAYGNSFIESEKIIKILYPQGIKPEQYIDVLTITRIIDKLFRIANKKDAFGENPWEDISGYGLLMSTI